MRAVARPSMAATRRPEIVDAFIALIARRGLEAVTLDDVAKAAGMQRPMVRHFVGNRGDLIVAAVAEVTRRYEAKVRAALGDEPTIDTVIDVLFGPVWLSGLVAEDEAFDVLMHEAARSDATRAEVRRTYTMLLDEIDRALARSRPSMSTGARRDCAYALVCLAEHNVAMQQLGFPSARTGGARQAARSLVS
jgi:AcrR family transcriptional regulator